MKRGDLRRAIQIENHVAGVGEILMTTESRWADSNRTRTEPHIVRKGIRRDADHRRRRPSCPKRIAGISDRPHKIDVGRRRPGSEYTFDRSFKGAGAMIRVDEVTNLREFARS